MDWPRLHLAHRVPGVPVGVSRDCARGGDGDGGAPVAAPATSARVGPLAAAASGGVGAGGGVQLLFLPAAATAAASPSGPGSEMV